MIQTEYFQLKDEFSFGSHKALVGVIEGAEVYIHKINKSHSLVKSDCSGVSLYFVFEGECSFNKVRLSERSTYIPKHDSVGVFESKETALLLEICLKLSDEEIKALENKLPFTIEYSAARAYKEDCKSERTTSRMILEDGIIPRFALGSVESDGPDSVLEHEHANVDQFFFSLPGTDCYLTVSGESLVFPEKTAMHIPLGSSHGVRVEEGKKLHYLWCDFYLDETTSDYIRSAHKFI